MRRFVLMCALLAAACAEAPQTYRDLDRLGEEYQRETMGPPQSPADATARDSCGASAFRGLMGTPADQIDRSTLPPGTRVIMPGQMVTMDFSAGRLNIRVAPDGRVAALECF